METFGAKEVIFPSPVASFSSRNFLKMRPSNSDFPFQ